MSSGVAEAGHSAKDESLRLAIAISLLRSKFQNRQSSSAATNSRFDVPSQTDVLRWKQKAKERKKEIIRLQEDLKDAESASHCDLFPENASCKCYFFDNLGEFSGRRVGEASEQRFNDVLRRRFLRLVRTRSRKSTRSSQKLHLSEPEYEEEAEHLRISVDLLVELCKADSNAPNFSSWSHQAVDFILASLKNLMTMGRNLESLEESISSMITRLIARMCTPFKGDVEREPETNAGFYVQHLIRKLGSEPYIGQRALFAISQRISILAENLLFMDPFEESFYEMDECIFTLIQLIEFLISDYLVTWAENEGFETGVFEECVTSVIHARKAVLALEERNGLYLLYMDRVIGELAKRVGQITSFRELEPAIMDKILAFPD